MTQPERLEQSIERVTKGFAGFVEQFDLFTGRKLSNFIIDANNQMAASWDVLADKMRRAREEQEAINISLREAALLAQTAPPRSTAPSQGIFGVPTTTGADREFGRKTFSPPVVLPEMDTAGREGRKELIDGVDSAFDKNLTKHGLAQQPQRFGDAFARVWSPTVEKSDTIARQADTANRQGLDDIERAIFGLEGTLQSVGTTIVRNASGVTVGESADQERISEFERIARETPGLGASGPITLALRNPRVPAFSELGKVSCRQKDRVMPVSLVAAPVFHRRHRQTYQHSIRLPI